MPTNKFEEESKKTVMSLSTILTVAWLSIFIIFMLKGGVKIISAIAPSTSRQQQNQAGGGPNPSYLANDSDPAVYVESLVVLKGQWSKLVPTTQSGNELGKIDFRSERSGVLVDIMVSLGNGQEAVYSNLESGSTRVPSGLSYRFKLSGSSSHDAETLYLKRFK